MLIFFLHFIFQSSSLFGQIKTNKGLKNDMHAPCRHVDIRFHSCDCCSICCIYVPCSMVTAGACVWFLNATHSTSPDCRLHWLRRMHEHEHARPPVSRLKPYRAKWASEGGARGMRCHESRHSKPNTRQTCCLRRAIPGYCFARRATWVCARRLAGEYERKRGTPRMHLKILILFSSRHFPHPTSGQGMAFLFVSTLVTTFKICRVNRRTLRPLGDVVLLCIAPIIRDSVRILKTHHFFPASK